MIENDVKFCKNEEKILQLFSSPVSYHLTEDSIFCNGKYSLNFITTTNVNNQLGISVDSATTGTRITTRSNAFSFTVTSSRSQYYVSLSKIYKLTENIAIVMLQSGKYWQSFCEFSVIFINDSGTFKNGSFSIFDSYNISGDPDVPNFYKCIRDPNIFSIVFEYYSSSPTSTQKSVKAINYTINETTISKGDTFEVFFNENGNKSVGYLSKTRPRGYFYSLDYQIDDSNIVISRGDTSTWLSCFPYGLYKAGYNQYVGNFTYSQSHVCFFPDGTVLNEESNGIPGNMLGIYWAKDKNQYYAVTFNPGTYKYSRYWPLNKECIVIYKFNPPGTFTQTDLTIADIIDYIM